MQTNDIIRIRILELEDKLMDLIEISINYGFLPITVFEPEKNANLIGIEYLENSLN